MSRLTRLFLPKTSCMMLEPFFRSSGGENRVAGIGTFGASCGGIHPLCRGTWHDAVGHGARVGGLAWKGEPLAAGEFWSWDMRIGTNCVSGVVGYCICIRHGIMWHWTGSYTMHVGPVVELVQVHFMCAQFKHSRSEVSPSSKMLGHSTPGSKTLRKTHRWTFRSITWQVNTLSWLNGKVWHWITFHEGTSLDLQISSDTLTSPKVVEDQGILHIDPTFQYYILYHFILFHVSEIALKHRSWNAHHLTT